MHQLTCFCMCCYFPGVPRFYDISGMTQNPEVFQLCIDVFVKRYAAMDVDAIAGLDARGFVLGPPIALALKKPFIMIRKKGKLPNAVTGQEYRKEYEGANANGGDELCISRTAIQPGARILVIDDLVATGVCIIMYYGLCTICAASVSSDLFVVDSLFCVAVGYLGCCRGPAQGCERHGTYAHHSAASYFFQFLCAFAYIVLLL